MEVSGAVPVVADRSLPPGFVLGSASDRLPCSCRDALGRGIFDTSDAQGESSSLIVGNLPDVTVATGATGVRIVAISSAAVTST